jgi:EAL domain-containing protein (putative c-di-GMP-specific phosphodiesterase class I)
MDAVFGTSSLGGAVALLDALEQQQLTLEYQAVVESVTGRLHGVEALLRWAHPDRGRLLPGEFLPEQLSGGLGWAITRHVVTEAITQCAAWRAQGLDVAVSVNVPPAVIIDGAIVDLVRDALADHAVPADRLVVEVTENGGRSDMAPMRDTCVALARLGIRLSLDDFGLGDSSLARLQQIHFDEIKIDRSFVMTAPRSPTDRAIVLFATELAHHLGMQVVAEGVENPVARDRATELGVDFQQGFLWHRPAPAADVAARYATSDDITLP